MNSAKLICFEGPDGSGKSTQARALAKAISGIYTRQPGGTPLGSVVRELLLDPDRQVSARAEALLMAADRAQHVDEMIRPTLESGTHVVCDRFIGSSIAYQGFGRELGADAVEALSLFAVNGVTADLVILLDVDPAVSEQRMARGLDRIEREPPGFRARVRSGYHAQAAADPHTWVVIDAAGSIESVQASIRAAVGERLGIVVNGSAGSMGVDTKVPNDE